jgi:hypothetical protein
LARGERRHGGRTQEPTHMRSGPKDGVVLADLGADVGVEVREGRAGRGQVKKLPL